MWISDIKSFISPYECIHIDSSGSVAVCIIDNLSIVYIKMTNTRIVPFTGVQVLHYYRPMIFTVFDTATIKVVRVAPFIL